MKTISVLLLDSDGTQLLPVAESLYKSGYLLHAIYNHRLSYGYGTKYIHYKSIHKFISEEEYLTYLLKYIADNNIGVLFPLSDRTALIVSKYQLLFKKTRVVAPNYNSFDMGYDKNKLMHVCLQLGVPHPKTYDMSKVDVNDINDIIFPAIIKPNITTGGRGMTIVESSEDIKVKINSIVEQYGPCHIQEYIQAGGRQIKVQLFLNNNSELLYYSVIHKQRYYPEKGGSSCCNETIIDDRAVNNCYKVLKAINWVGFADFDLIEDPKDFSLKIMEINPRMPACIKSAIKSGVDYANIYVNYALNNECGAQVSLPGFKLRHIGFDILWFIHSKNRFRVSPSWFSFFSENQYFQDFSLNDCLPFFLGTLANIKKILSPSFRKQKSGLR